jgi:hypothetical protein
MGKILVELEVHDSDILLDLEVISLTNCRIYSKFN